MSGLVNKNERGWPGHFICADRCLFHRNTLLTLGDVRIVVSTVGLMQDIHNLKERKFEMIGCERYFETMAFYANNADTRYYDINVERQISFDSPWAIGETDADDRANDMHDVVVAEIEGKMHRREL